MPDAGSTACNRCSRRHVSIAQRRVIVNNHGAIGASVRTDDALRQALREERWGDAVFSYISRTGVAVDVYESTELHAPADAAVAPVELQLTPLFTG